MHTCTLVRMIRTPDFNLMRPDLFETSVGFNFIDDESSNKNTFRQHLLKMISNIVYAEIYSLKNLEINENGSGWVGEGGGGNFLI